jgi:hypothetical protein
MDLNVDKTDVANPDPAVDVDRRDAVRKLGKFAAYAAPFTVLALSGKKASAATASGGGFHPQSSPTGHK